MRDYLRKLREKKAMTQQQAADSIGITQQYYCMVETGERQQKMDLHLAKKLAKTFSVPIEYILENEEKIS